MLVSGMAPKERGKAVFLMLQAFIDDSGSDADSRMFVLGGYVAAMEQWQKFSEEWQASLARPPSIPYFKMSEAMAQPPQGPFKGMSKGEVSAIVEDLCRIIKRNVICTVTMGVGCAIYKQLLRGRVHGLYDNPYYLCFAAMLQTVRVVQGMMIRPERVHLVFDKQRGFGNRALELVTLKDPENNAIASVTFGDSKLQLPLQAADLAAWRIRRRSIFKGHERLPIDPAACAPLRDIPNVVMGRRDDSGEFNWGLSPEGLSEWADQMARMFPVDGSSGTFPVPGP